MATLFSRWLDRKSRHKRTKPVGRTRPLWPTRVHLLLEALEDRVVPTGITAVVANTNDAGPGSLRQAILDTNSATDASLIQFAIPGSGVQEIQLASALPEITNSVAIDGTTQPNYAGTPLIELNGSGAGSGVSGLVVSASSSSVIGLDINGFSADGIVLNAGSGTIQANYIGTDPTGMVAVGNGGKGITILSDGNEIGGTTAGAGNLISGNASYGIQVFGSGAEFNVIQGNLIGTDNTGTTPIPNGIGISIEVSPNNTIGGTALRAGNIISGNSNSGIEILGSDSSGTVVQGNLIGTDVTGGAALGNEFGIQFVGAGPSILIGGITADARNIISGNATDGIMLDDSSNETIAGNYVGTEVTGAFVLTNAGNGIVIQNGSSNNVIGGTTAGAGNVISGNATNGIEIDSGSNQVEGNFVGTNAAGTGALGNGGNGIAINGAAGNTIGGLTSMPGTGAGNVLSGNGGNGILITGAGAIGNVVEGNLVGTDVTGTQPLGNQSNGVQLDTAASGNTIGGTAPGAANVVSGNGVAANFSDGILLVGTGTSNNLVEGNFIGTNAAGTSAIPNAWDGLDIDNGASSNTAGGTSAAARNIISGNFAGGVDLFASGSANVIEGNYLGTDVTGNQSLGIQGTGLAYGGGSSGNVFGGTVPGAGNLISGATFAGIYNYSPDSPGNLIEGNFIGTNAAGTGAVPNTWVGITVQSGFNTIGGTAAGAGNVISGNNTGIQLEAGNNLIEGNFIGTNADGTAAVAGSALGIGVQSGSNTIGGTTSGTGDVISGNSWTGVYLYGSADTGNVVLGNLIGTNAAGTGAVANGSHGILVNGGSANTIGGASAGARNVISGNSGDGIDIVGGAPQIKNLAAVNQLITGTLPSTSATGIVAQADFSDQTSPSNGDWGYNNPIPGSGGTNYGFVATGTLQVNTAGTFTFDSASDDGSELLIDGTPVVIVDQLEALQENFGTVTLSQGAHTLEWIGFQDGSAAGFELSVAAGAGITGPITTANGWHVLGDPSPDPQINLEDTLATTVYYSTPVASNDVISGNFIGTNADGTAALPNAGDGITLNGAIGNTIGGATGTPGTGAGNVISGNGGWGVDLGGASNNFVQGNLIGTDSTGTVAIGNGSNGIEIGGAATGNMIGGADASDRNIVVGSGYFFGSGIELDGTGPTNNVIANNYIGTDITGTVALGNIAAGVQLYLVPGSNTIGLPGAGNVISGNAYVGINIGGSMNTLVQGNFIGTNASGTEALANGASGVFVSSGASGNTIGGASSGDANVISGNNSNGVYITGSGTTGNVVLGNLIGTNAAGTAALSNRGTGVLINGGASANTIGGSVNGAGNVISGNGAIGSGNSGITLADFGTSNNVIAGNIIGLNAAGSAAIPNSYDGIVVAGAVSDNTIGGTTAGARNIISGNLTIGVEFFANSFPNVLEGNFIGTDITGTIAIGNAVTGTQTDAGSTGATIGGTVAGAGNLISGNAAAGVGLFAGSSLVEGNLIGTDVTGTHALGNGGGVSVSGSTNNTIGGTAAGAGNLISGNLSAGIALFADSNLVQGNLIGTDITGTHFLANNGAGVLAVGPSDITIGGDTAGAGNLIMGNADDGVLLVDDTNVTIAGNVISGNGLDGLQMVRVTTATVAGNYIGTDITGALALGNGHAGVNLDGVSDATIGGVTAGSRNVISANAYEGLGDFGNADSDNVIEGNYIGTDVTGTHALGNIGGGVQTDGSGDTIGGTAAGAGNLISGNLSTGIGLYTLGSILVEGNLIGTDVTGTHALGNAGIGVQVDSDGDTIGGTAAGAGNVISGNGGNGVQADVGDGLLIQGNLIGTDITGTIALGNLGNGVQLDFMATNVTIGGTAAGARNVISANGSFPTSSGGIDIFGSTTGTLIQGNLIGTDVTGTHALGNFVNCIAVISE